MTAEAQVGRTNDRVFLAELDSTIQAEFSSPWETGDDSADTVEGLLGRLRLETLLSKQIVVTDAQFLDGRHLMQLALAGDNRLRGLRRVRDEPLPIVLRARRPSIFATLLAMYTNPRGFLPSLFDNGEEVRRGLSESLGARINKKKLTKKDLRPLLEHSGVDPAVLKRAHKAWRRVDRLCAKRDLQLETWPKNRTLETGFVLSDTLRPWEPFLEGLLPSLMGVTPPSPDLMQGSDRSTVYAELNHIAESSTEELVKWSVDRMRFWFDERYRRAIAFQHEADFRGSGLVDHSLISHTAQISGRTTKVEIELPDQFVEYLGALSDSSWMDKISANSLSLRKWWADGTVNALEKVLNYFCADFRQGEPTSRDSALVKLFGFISDEAADLLPTPARQFAKLVLWLSQPDSSSRGRITVQATDYYDDVESHPLNREK